MEKRKRDLDGNGQVHGRDERPTKLPKQSPEKVPVTVQIITGSYERVLHGFQATIVDTKLPDSTIQFVDTFLFNAHSSSIRCIALSPLPEQNTLSENVRVTLASGGTDERVNLYSLSASPLAENDRLPSVPTLAGNKILENPNNRQLGSLLHHSSSITALYFPTRSKLLAASEDNTISVSRTKDFEVVSTIKAPRPKVRGQPSGDTAPPGVSPMGVNDFAVHPSMKLMVSVGKSEKSMRLWNLVTGKKAGVLNFGRDVLESVKESKHSSGEGRRIEWSPDGEEFAVAFERGVIVYGTDSLPSCKILPSPLTKFHQMRYIQLASKWKKKASTLLTLSTEDGRVIFYSTANSSRSEGDTDEKNTVHDAMCIAQLGGKDAGMPGRIKDFEILQHLSIDGFIVLTAGSDGAVRLWTISRSEISTPSSTAAKGPIEVPRIGALVGTYETGNRITCLKAFVMLPAFEEDDALADGTTEPEEGEEEDDADEEDEEEEE